MCFTSFDREGCAPPDWKRDRWLKYLNKKYVVPLRWMALGGALVYGGMWAYEKRARELQVRGMEYVLKGGKYHQVIGFAWDTRLKDFNVLTRPLHHCKGQYGSHEAHLFNTAPLSSFERAVHFAELDFASQARALPGPFVLDPDWTASDIIRPTPKAQQAVVQSPATGRTLSGYGAFSHNAYK